MRCRKSEKINGRDRSRTKQIEISRKPGDPEQREGNPDLNTSKRQQGWALREQSLGWMLAEKEGGAFKERWSAQQLTSQGLLMR